MNDRCKHKIIPDHITKKVDGKWIWQCSSCKEEGPWTESHSSYGNIECETCGFAEMDWVACSDTCAEIQKKALSEG